ncbi:MgtC/SapB family protein [Roseobacter sp. HKCCA0434]|uniref:MgtC/SapB family protein n=1 Tax=Roseobacter sp. HKCCA0434 TaxID=3079297 RepID=UPI002905E924|nr:MgtC/SapB family protein [Roseobacter sp. HKCCA0434]
MLDLVIAEFSDPNAAVPTGIVLLRMLAAAVLGGAIGLEREAFARNAGLRTHVMIALAACLFALIAFELVGMGDSDRLQFDPLRLIEAVTAGVAFLAAGSIITSGVKVKGLTTGASMWLAGAVGLACGTGRLTLALMATGMALAVLFLLSRVSHKVSSKADDEDLSHEG